MPITVRVGQGDDGLFRIAGTIANPTNLAATQTNALVFALQVDSGTLMVPTQSTRLKYNRLDNINSTFNSYVYLRRAETATLVPQPFFQGRAPRYGVPQTVVNSAVGTRAVSQVCDASFKGVNGFVLASQSYKVARNGIGEIFQDIKIPYGRILGDDSIFELALVIGATDLSQVTATAHFDFVETV